VVDFSAYNARATRDATTLLRQRANIYVHISTDSVYDVCDPDSRETGPVREEHSERPDDLGLRDLLSTHHEVFKILSGIYDKSTVHSMSLTLPATTRGHNEKPFCNKNVGYVRSISL